MLQSDRVPSQRWAGAEWFIAMAAAAVAFSVFYLRVTRAWSSTDFASYVQGTMHYPQALEPFRYRALMPLLGRALLAAVPVDPLALFRTLTVFEVLALLLAFRALLAKVVRPGKAGVYALAILYPLTVNYCVLNRLYFPFDLPAIVLFVLGYGLAWRRAWRLYYLVLALATLNRETSAALVVVCGLGLWGEMPARRLALHLAAQAVVWAAVVVGVHAALGGGSSWSRMDWFHANVNTVRNMLTLRGNALRDWAKLVLAFGGLAWTLPWVLRGQPGFVRRSVWVVLPILAASFWRGIVDEVRLYAELVPVLTVPVVLALAALRGDLAVPGGPRGLAPASVAPARQHTDDTSR